MPRVHAVIHADPRIAWHLDVAPRAAAGLRRCGMDVAITRSRERLDGGLPILLGTTLWRAIESTGPFLLVDRCSYGDPGRFVSLVRDGHGRRGDHRTPQVRDGSRWERHAVAVQPWHADHGTRRILCGQTETYSPHHARPEDWYDHVGAACTHFRPHPAAAGLARPCAATGLPVTRTWDDARAVVTLNSSVAVESVLAGIPTVTMDEAAMAWDVTGREPGDERTPERTEWLHWLAWTQWTHDEIEEGIPWPRLL